jgi:gamma-glutamylcysteine synthetase
MELPEMEGEYYDPESGGFETCTFKPELADLQYLRTFKFEDLTYRGTVEFRSCCTQPIRDTFCVAAFHLGLLEKLGELDQLLENDQVLYHHGYTASELRHLFVRRQYPPYISKEGLYRLVGQILDLARQGLSARGMNEECFLDPLYDRLNRKSNPAMDMLRMLEEGKSIEDVILLYR